MRYKVESCLHGQGEAVICAWVLGEAREHKAGSPPWGRGWCPCLAQLPKAGGDTGRGSLSPVICIPGHADTEEGPMVGHGGCGMWPRAGGSEHIAGGEQPPDTD